MQPNIIEQIADVVVNKFNSEISENAVLVKLTEELREAIKENRILEYREEFISKYKKNN